MPGQKKPPEFIRGFVAGRTGLEPAASGVTGRRYNQLNYRPKGLLLKTEQDSGRRIAFCQDGINKKHGL